MRREDDVDSAKPVSADGRHQDAAEDQSLSPGLSAFTQAYQRGQAQVVWTRLVADLETPVSVYLKLAGKGRCNFLLESVEGGAQRGRYSVIGLNPDLIWRARGDAAEISVCDATGVIGPPRAQDQPALQSLRALLDASRITLPKGLPPMSAGIFGYMGYDTIRLVETLTGVNPDPLGVPDAILLRPTIIVIFDNVRDEMTIVTPVRPSPGVDAATAYTIATGRLHAAISALSNTIDHTRSEGAAGGAMPEPVSNTSPAEYLAMVAQAKEYIAAGDIFQVVLSQRFSAPFALPSIALYRSLRRLNPSPFLFHLDLGDFALVGSSPEILVRLRDGEVTIRPIAGTVRRGADDEEDQLLAKQLLGDPKERAEHLMLLDLGRNDVGRVTETGTINVTDRFVIERYSHVMHIVSNVVGRLAPQHDAIDALMAGFPAGTVSGAPKVRAMQVIDELEKAKRGPYAGCVGYFSAGGEMDTCIVLRTAIVKDGMLHVQAGAGVVHDSVPENEQQECVNKAKAIVRAAEEAIRYASGSAGLSSGKGNGGVFG